MGRIPGTHEVVQAQKRILVLYDHHWTHVKTIQHYLESLRRYSRHQVFYATSLARCPFDLDYFDAVVLHYSVRVCFAGHLSPSFSSALKRYQGLKCIFLQDEYENTRRTWAALKNLGVGVVFTCVPAESVSKVYPREEFPSTLFVPVLTGYVPLDIFEIPAAPPLAERPLLIGYRGRNIGYWYGDLGQEKVQIGRRMKEICDQRRLRTDIAWEENDRIYGDAWFQFLGSCRATLGSESGCNIFDFDGTLASSIQAELTRNPQATYEEVREKYLVNHQGQIRMNQISPKIFEAIACRTALVLFEGEYSGVLVPETHFLPLRKDFSNIDDVLRRLDDLPALSAMVERAYQDIVLSGRWSYRALGQIFDDALARANPAFVHAADGPWLPLPPCDALPAFRLQYERNWQTPLMKRMWQCLPSGFREGFRNRMKNFWNHSPAWVQNGLMPALNRIKVLLKGSA